MSLRTTSVDSSLGVAVVAAGIIGFCAGVTAAWFVTIDEYKRARRMRADAQEKFVALQAVLANMHVLQAAATTVPVAAPDVVAIRRNGLN